MPRFFPLGVDDSELDDPLARKPLAATSAPPAQPITAQPITATPSTVAVNKTPLGSPKLQADQAELQRLESTGSGIDQFSKQPGVGRKIGTVLARVGDAVGGAMFPAIAAQVPGTTLHHNTLVHQARARVANDLSDAQSQAQTHNLEMQPELKEQKLENEHQKFIGSLAQHGQKLDENGKVVDDEDSAIYQSRKLHDDYFKARKDYTDAQTEFEKTKADPNNPQYLLAQQRLNQAEERMRVMSRLIDVQQQRVNVMRDNYNLHATGTNAAGEPLPGAMLDDNNNPIGTSFQGNVRPTGQQRGKANLAQSADEQLKDMKEIVQKRPDIFGPAAGRKTDFNVWLGSQDPDAQRFRAARTIAGDHLAGVFGGRSEAALNALDAAIGHYKDNPKAIISGLDQLSKANASFVKAGTVHTVGSKEDNRGSQEFSVPADAPTAPKEDGHQLKADGKVIAVSKGGKWVRP